MNVKFEVFVPKENSEEIIHALDAKGFLTEGNYKRVYALSAVEGHFTPVQGANPFLGQVGVQEVVEEVKLEFRVDSLRAKEAYDLVVQAHPYEVPVINMLMIIDMKKEESPV